MARYGKITIEGQTYHMPKSVQISQFAENISFFSQLSPFRKFKNLVGKGIYG